jgi:hypothetical protein
MPELFIRLKINVNSEPELLAEDRIKVREFYSKRAGQTCEWLLRDEQEIRSLIVNRFHWGAILPNFCPDNFDTPEDAHAYFTGRYLLQQDIIDIREDVFSLTLAKIVKYASRSRNTIVKEQIDDYTFKITWIRSTSTLTKKMFTDYINKIILFGQTELGLSFESLENYDPYKSMR